MLIKNVTIFEETLTLSILSQETLKSHQNDDTWGEVPSPSCHLRPQ